MSGPVREVTVRAATKNDAARMCGLLNGVIRAGGTTAMEEELDLARFRDLFVDGPNVLLAHVAVDRDTGRVAAFQGLAIDNRLPKGWADIATFASAGRRRGGIGRLLFAATLEAAADLGVETINAAIRADNEAGLAYYAALGFIPWQTLKSMPLRDGTPVDRLFKRLDLHRTRPDGFER